MSKAKKFITIAAGITILLIIASSFYVIYVEPDTDSYSMDVDYLTEDATKIHGVLYIPRLLPLYLLQNNGTVPAIVVLHGLGGSHYDTEGLAKVFNLNGMVAFALDMRGHGQSLGGFDLSHQPWQNFQPNSLKLALDVKGAIDLLIRTCRFVNSSQIGIYGGSLGGLAATTEGYLHDLANATVNVCMAKFEMMYFLNSTNPSNYLMIIGTNDDLFSTEEAILIFYLACGNQLVSPYQNYGNFSNGTARRLILMPTEHEIVPSNPLVIYEVVNWYKMAFFNSTTGTTLSVDVTKYLMNLVSTVTGFAGFFFIMFLIPGIILFFKRFGTKKHLTSMNFMKSTENDMENGEKFSLLRGILMLLFVYFVSAIIIFPAAGLFWWIPAIGGNFLASILVVFAGFGILGIYFLTRRAGNFSLKKILLDKDHLIKPLLIGFIAFSFIFFITNIVPLEHTLLRTPNTAVTILIFFLLFVPFLLVDEIWNRYFIQKKFDKYGSTRNMALTIPITAGLKAAFFGLIFLCGMIYNFLGFPFIDELVLKLMVPAFLLIMMLYVCVYAPFIFQASKRIHASTLCCALLLAFDFATRMTVIVF